MYKFFRFPFATSGDKSAVPDAVQLTGAVSYEQGWGRDYQLNPKADPAAKNVPRQSFNQILGDITGAIRDFQTMGVPDWIEPIQNGGSPYAYAAASLVRYDDGTGPRVYHNTVDGNVNDPTGAGWEPASFSGGGNTTATVTLADDVSVGDFVAALNSGSVERIKQSAAAGSLGAINQTLSSQYSRLVAAHDPINNKILMVLRDANNSNIGGAFVGAILGNTVTWGSEFAFGFSASDFYGICYDATANKFLIAYRDVGASNIGKCIVATVSGTSVTFGTPVTFYSSAMRNSVCAYCPSAGASIISFLDNVTLKMWCIPAQISGTSVTLGTASELSAAGRIELGSHGLAYDAASSKVLMTACDTDNSGYPFGCVLTVSPGAITFGTPVVFASTGATAAKVAALSAGDGLAVVTAGSTGIVRRATITGTDPTFDAPATWYANALTSPICVPEGPGLVTIYYNDMLGASSTGFPTCISMLYGPDGFDVGPPYRVSNSEVVGASKTIAYDPVAGKSLVAWVSSFTNAAAYTSGSFTSNSSDVIGVALEDKLTGENCRIVPLGGIDTTTTGLSIGQDYYITGTGLRTTTAGTNVYVGRAVAPNQLLLRSVTKR